MKRILLSALLFLATFTVFPQVGNFDQFTQYPIDGNGNVAGGLGLNWIDGELFYTLHFRPDVSIGNYGVGLDLQLDINKHGNLRTEDFRTFGDYVRIIRYARYGLKNDPLFIKLGALDYYSIGDGTIIDNYNNSPSFDARRTGLVFDVDFGYFGFESIYSSFGEAGVVGLRGHVRPLKYTSLAAIPIISNFEVGATFAGDFNKDAAVISGSYDRTTNTFNKTQSFGSLQIVGIDFGFPLLTNSLFGLKIYTDFSKIINFGSGIATGIKADFNGFGLVNASAKLERRWNNGQYIPAYFNSFYEIERFRVDTSSAGSGGFTSKARELASITNADNGYYGELLVNFMGLLGVTGSYQRLDKTPDSGILHLVTEIAPNSFPIVVRGGYDKINIGSETDLFRLDDRSYLYFELGYKPYPYLLVSMVYQWTFSPVRDVDNNIVSYAPQKRIEPRVTFSFPFTM